MDTGKKICTGKNTKMIQTITYQTKTIHICTILFNEITTFI